jgi:hypothetical protein
VYSCSEKKNQGRFRHVGSDHSLVSVVKFEISVLSSRWIAESLPHCNREMRTVSTCSAIAHIGRGIRYRCEVSLLAYVSYFEKIKVGL